MKYLSSIKLISPLKCLEGYSFIKWVAFLNIHFVTIVFWRLKEGDFSYARFFVQRIEYDKPEMF